MQGTNLMKKCFTLPQ